MKEENLDSTVVLRLADSLLTAVRDHLRSRPNCQASNYEALNALAIATGTLLAGARMTGFEAEARTFFGDALESGVDEFVKMHVARTGSES